MLKMLKMLKKLNKAKMLKAYIYKSYIYSDFIIWNYKKIFSIGEDFFDDIYINYSFSVKST